jgi:hypothetical protein
MFPPRLSVGRPRSDPVLTGAPAPSWHASLVASMLRLGLLVAPLAAALPGTASAQALGTMQVTARVLPGLPSWAGLAEVQGMTRQALLAPSGGTKIRRAGLVQARAALASGGGPRRLLITIDYPRN